MVSFQDRREQFGLMGLDIGQVVNDFITHEMTWKVHSVQQVSGTQSSHSEDLG